MARYIGPNCRLCRREGVKLFLKGEKCFTTKCPMENEKVKSPGVAMGRKRRKMNLYGDQLREKQKVKRQYGVLEKQFRNYFEDASKQKGVTGTILLQLLERRLDNVTYRAGFAPSRKSARQLIRHGHFLINGRKVSFPSYQVKIGDLIEIKDRSKSLDLVNGSLEARKQRGIPSWISLDFEKKKAVFNAIPERMDLPPDIREHLIVELYSK
ncbi:30S ribosomal protein S4 [candidate division WOR-3 bacterium]|nr:30S ribosomal protein S4 [candidate division WOR-3 bacterium]